MKTFTLDRISLVKDYVSSDFNRENEETELHFCIDSIKENIILLTRLKEDPTLVVECYDPDEEDDDDDEDETEPAEAEADETIEEGEADEVEQK